ncbi:MAG: LytR C-terminal domain-containing protein [Lachnospiraceae bacterium]|nr:LytR C-terminal domain-containing protein [Lachnospiraceae bacterium]
MDKRTLLRVFGEAFLRSMVVLMAIAIIGFGTFFIVRVNSDKKDLAKNETASTTEFSEKELHAMLEEENANDTESTTAEATTEEATTEETTTEVQTIPSTDKNILILNSTNVSGLAGAWMNKISSGGFANIAVGNYNSGSETQTKIYVAEEGMGEDLLTYFDGATIVVGSLGTSSYTIKSGASMSEIDIFIVIGSNDSTVQ